MLALRIIVEVVDIWEYGKTPRLMVNHAEYLDTDVRSA